VPGKEAQWKGFVRQAKLADAPGDLTTVVAEFGVFLLPIAQAVASGANFHLTWRAPGPWA